MTQKDDKYKDILTQQEYHVLFEKGTEPPFSHPYNTLKEKGIYHCKNCESPLFESHNKFDSGSGWPSFFDQINNAVQLNEDHSHGMARIEITCHHCQCHLGHVFSDGPQPTGLRYCVNGASLNFCPDEDL